MNDLLSLPVIQTLGLTLLHFLWQGSIVGIVLFVTLCLLRKPQTRYAVSCFCTSSSRTFAFHDVYKFV
jgi:bla regulator protein blaR1